MRVEGFRYRDEWIPNYYSSRKVGPDYYLRLSRLGGVQILDGADNSQLDEIYMEEALFKRLEKSGHIITERNSADVMAGLRKWHQKTYSGPALHIVVLSKRCNLNCTYCHMEPEPLGSSSRKFDMQPDVIDAVVRFALSSPVHAITFEFQGGEPFLNFPGMVRFVEEACRQNASVGKELSFSVVSNLMLVNEDHLNYCRKNGIHVSYSLNGPEAIHDQFRVTRNGRGSFAKVMSKLRRFRTNYADVLSTSPLCVVGDDNADDLIPTIDFYHQAGFKGVAILKLKHLGNTKSTQVNFDIRRFLKYYISALDYIYEKNRRLNESFAERTLRVVLGKIVSDSDIGYVDWRNPCGDFGGAITYDYDGEILPSDEARSLRSAFGLGNVLSTSYQELIGRKATFLSMNLSLRDRDPTCRECAFNPFCGVSPVLDYARSGDPTPKPHESEECLQTMAVLDWVFQKIIEDPIPLLRMLPGMDAKLMEMLDEGCTSYAS